jgi:hypothetical protein
MEIFELCFVPQICPEIVMFCLNIAQDSFIHTNRLLYSSVFYTLWEDTGIDLRKRQVHFEVNWLHL